MKKKLFQSVLFLTLLAIGVSCTQRMDVPLRSGDEKLVVEGYLFPKDSVSWIRLTKTSAYFSDAPSPAIRHAKVWVRHGQKQWLLSESDLQPGRYFLRDTSFHLIPSDTFQLKIKLQTPVGGYTDYESRTPVPPLRIHTDSIGIEFAPDFKKWMIRFYGQDLPGKDYYLFNSRVNGKIVSDSILLKTVRQDVFFDGRYVSGMVVQVLNENLLKSGDAYTLLASNITKEYYDYLRALQDEVADKNPLFSGPPANATGNISHGAMGFFTAFFTNRYRVTIQSLRKRNKVRRFR